MADSSEPKKVDKKAHGGTGKKTEKGAHGGGNQYNQMTPGKGFMVHDAKPGGVGGKKGGTKDGGDKKGGSK